MGCDGSDYRDVGCTLLHGSFIKYILHINAKLLQIELIYLISPEFSLNTQSFFRLLDQVVDENAAVDQDGESAQSVADRLCFAGPSFFRF